MNPTTEIKKKPEVFGSFFLGGSEFAVSVGQIQEIVVAPPSYSSLPLSPDYLLGIFNLRGTIIPVINLKKILNLSDIQYGDDAKVAILEYKGQSVGVLFDKTGEVFKSVDEERSDFARSAGIIRGVFKKEQGQRMLQILDVPAMFELKNVPFKPDSEERALKRKIQSARGPRIQAITFSIGPVRCAFGIKDIQEIIKTDKISNEFISDDVCFGSINLRGRTVPLIDFTALLGYRAKLDLAGVDLNDRRVIIMKLNGNLFGLLVESVESIINYYADEMLAFPGMVTHKADMFKGYLSIDDTSILLLTAQNVFSNEDVARITQGHSQLFHPNEQAKDASKTSKRNTYITFSMSGKYAVKIHSVQEIIAIPDNLIRIPGTRPECMGIFNLRGQLVTIIDARQMYAKEANTVVTDSKILIFKQEEAHFGLVVDSVESIVSFNDNSKMKLPELLYRDSAGEVAKDLEEAIQYKDDQGSDKSLLILNVDSIARRVNAS